MNDTKVVLQLQGYGDVLSTPRRVDHWLYFRSNDEANAFIKQAKGIGFSVEQQVKNGIAPLLYQVQIYRDDSVELNAINAVTSKLVSWAIELNGEYDG